MQLVAQRTLLGGAKMHSDEIVFRFDAQISEPKLLTSSLRAKHLAASISISRLPRLKNVEGKQPALAPRLPRCNEIWRLKIMAISAPRELPRRALVRVIAAASVGNFVEWFDFAAYGFLATLLTQEFFPRGSGTVGLLQIFAVFAVAFAFRPLGGIVFGVLGDRIGRKRVLAITLLTMASATTCIGLLPTYAQIGVWAPVLLTIARCIQGFSAGGEYAGACAFVMESAPREERAQLGSYVPVSTFLSFASAAAVAYALNALLPAEAMREWGWRLPFLAAAPVGLVGLYVRLSLRETAVFEELEARKTVAHSPLRETLSKQASSIVRLGAFVSVTGLSFYVFTTYFPSYLQTVGGMGRSRALLVTVIALLLSGFLCPFAGRFADTAGRRKTMKLTCWILIAGAYPAFWLASFGGLLPSLIGISVLGLGATLSGVVTAVLLTEIFPTRTRYTASAITYNLAFTLFGGTAPLICTFLIGATGSNLSPAFYLSGISLLGLIGAVLLPETKAIRLDEAGSDRSSHSVDAQAVTG